MNEPNHLKFNSLYQLQKKDTFKKMSTAQKAFVLKYISPLGYYKWHKMAFGMAIRTEKRPDKYRPSIFSAPAYYLTDQLVEAFINTSLNKLKLDKRPNIINHQYFVFQSLGINRAAYCLCTEYEESTHVRVACSGSKFDRKTGMTLKQEKNNLFTSNPFFNFHINWTDLTHTFNKTPRKKAMPVFEEQFNVIANFILFMNQQPDITYEKVPPSISLPIQMQTNRQDRFQPRPVTWIGKDFTERVIKIKPESDELLVKHPGKPKRSHWRRGHWHTILQGPKRKQRKMKWYQPVFIMGNKNDSMS